METNNRIKLLFVDDETNVIQGLKRMLYSMRNEWDMSFCTSGEEAIKILASQPVDVLITDMRMPGIDGTTLLIYVKEAYPQIVRIILSGYSEHEMAIMASGIAHQFLAKPSNADAIKSTIVRITSLRAYLHNENLLKQVSGIDSLPSLPKLYKEIEAEIRSEAPSLKRIGEIIAQDLTMTAKILQLVNSAFFGLPQKISDPVEAVNFIGMDIIKSLVLFAKIFSSPKLDSKMDMNVFWNHSMNVGRLAREIMRMENGSGKMQEETFIAGMLHDLGKLVFLEIPGYYEKVLTVMQSNGLNCYDAEYKLYDTSHAEIGAYLLGLWGLPDYLVETLAFHHKPSNSTIRTFSVLAAVHIANHLDRGSDLDMDFVKAIGCENRIEYYRKETESFENPHE